MKNYEFNYRVYYEDTDAGGVVYNANYLKFAERARTDVLRVHGFSQDELLKKHGILFVVRKIEIDFEKPAKLDDLLTVKTTPYEFKGASSLWEQNIFFEKIKLCSIKVKIVVVNKDFRPIRLPAHLSNIFN